MLSRVVGICGRASSGKDTVAVHMVRNHGFKQLSLAQHIKDFCGKVFGFSQKQLWGSSSHREQIITVNWDKAQHNLFTHGPVWLELLGFPGHMQDLRNAFTFLATHYTSGVSARVVLQYMGTEFGRAKLGDDVWINALLRTAQEELINGAIGVVVSDVRFKNEINAIKNAKGRVIRLLRNFDAAGTGIVNHVSEMEQGSIPLEEFSFVLNNRGTLDELYQAVDVFVGCCCEKE